MEFFCAFKAEVDDAYYRCEVVVRRALRYVKGSVLRQRSKSAKLDLDRQFYDGHKDAAETTLAKAQAAEEEKIQLVGRPRDARSHAALGNLIIKHMQLLFQLEKFNKCEQILRSWNHYFVPVLENASH